MSTAKPGEVINLVHVGRNPENEYDYCIALFHCPGCHCAHGPTVHPLEEPLRSLDKGQRWGFNGDLTKPTFTPSIKVTMPYKGKPDEICHSFVTDGNIQFLGDCTHALAGQTVRLPPWLMLL